MSPFEILGFVALASAGAYAYYLYRQDTKSKDTKTK